MRKNKDATREHYRRCFGTADGRAVLGNMLLKAGFFSSDLKTTEQLAVENFMKEVLQEIGILKMDAIKSLVNKLFEVPVDMSK